MELAINNLCFKYPEATSDIISNLNLSINEGEILSIIGPNGVGKTTLSNILLNELTSYEGEILIDNHNVKDLNINERSKYIGVCTSHDTKIDLSVLDYLLLGYANKLSLFNSPSYDEEVNIRNLLEEFNISKLAERSFFSLSDGEKKLVKILKVIVQNPKVIIFDEPTSSLDLFNCKLIIDVIRKMQNDKIIIYITHDINQVLQLNSKVLLLKKNGYFYGQTAEVILKENIDEAYNVVSKVCYDEELKRKYIIV